MKKYRIIFFLLFFYIPVQSADSGMEEYRPLLNDSPFLSLAFKERLAQADTEGHRNLAFLGYARLDGEWQFCLYDKRRSNTHWVGLNGSVQGFTVTSFNVRRRTITLEKNSVSVNVALESH